jgi:hypothetical protein
LLHAAKALKKVKYNFNKWFLVFRIRNGFNADLDPAFYHNADPDPKHWLIKV